MSTKDYQWDYAIAQTYSKRKCQSYIDDILHVTKGSFSDHLEGLEKVFKRLESVGLKVNFTKSSSAKGSSDYLGYHISRTGITPIPKKIEAIRAIRTPKTCKQLRSFLGMINFYRDMRSQRASLLAPLSVLTSVKVPFKWLPEHQLEFDTMKRFLAREVLCSYPNFSKPFVIHTDASKRQIGAFISQDGKPIAFYSRKLNKAQKNYTVTEKELLSIVATLKEFRNILLGHKVIVHTDHKNLTCKNFNTERVMRWRLVLEEFGPELNYIKGENNIVTDALSRLDMDTDKEIFNLTEAAGYDSDDLLPGAFPIRYADIQKFQQKDLSLQAKLKNNPDYMENIFHGGEKDYKLVCQNRKIVIPLAL